MTKWNKLLTIWWIILNANHGDESSISWKVTPNMRFTSPSMDSTRLGRRSPSRDWFATAGEECSRRHVEMMSVKSDDRGTFKGPSRHRRIPSTAHWKQTYLNLFLRSPLFLVTYVVIVMREVFRGLFGFFPHDLIKAGAYGSVAAQPWAVCMSESPWSGVNLWWV